MTKYIRNKISSHNRKRKMRYFLEHINYDHSIIDVGVAPIQNVPGTFLTNYIEEYFLLKNRKITALGLESEDYSFFRQRYTNCELILFDGISFKSIPTPMYPRTQTNAKYDVAVSNAVIEHVGDYSTQLKWLRGLAGICKKLIITTPNKFFPVEVHTNVFFAHWFGKKIQEKLLNKKIKLRLDRLNLLTKRQFITLLESAGFTIQSFNHNRFCLCTMDFVVVAVTSADDVNG